MIYKELELGCSISTRQELEDLNVLDPAYRIKFITYDIETLPNEEIHGDRKVCVQKPSSIAYYDGENGKCFVGDKIVKQFLDRMKEIQVNNLHLLLNF